MKVQRPSDVNGLPFNMSDDFSGFTPSVPEDGCTLCGICLSVCPTYKQTEDVEQSPMGRIRMMRALDDGTTKGMALEKLQSCLGCYACEAICPSRVRYGEMLDQALVTVRRQLSIQFITRLMLWLADKPARIKLLTRLSAIAEYTGLRGLLRGLGLFKVLGLTRADRFFATPSYPASKLNNRLRRPRYDQRVTMFRGCFSSVLERELQQTAITLLNALGIEVLIPEGQACCGALHRHNGDSKTALSLAQQNIKAFNQQQTTAIVSTSSGCGASLLEYGSWMEMEETPFKQPPMDISHYLALVLRQRKLIFKPLSLRVAIHTPCTLNQHIGQANAVMELLQTIPGLELHTLSGAPACCGAGGSQILSQPEMADALRDPIIEEVKSLKPDILLSSNLGCAMHLKAGLEQAGLQIEIKHPVQLLAQALVVEFISVRPGRLR